MGCEALTGEQSGHVTTSRPAERRSFLLARTLLAFGPIDPQSQCCCSSKAIRTCENQALQNTKSWLTKILKNLVTIWMNCHNISRLLTKLTSKFYYYSILWKIETFVYIVLRGSKLKTFQKKVSGKSCETFQLLKTFFDREQGEGRSPQTFAIAVILLHFSNLAPGGASKQRILK